MATNSTTRVNYQTPALKISMTLRDGEINENPTIVWVKGGKGLKLTELQEAVAQMYNACAQHNSKVTNEAV